MKCAACGYEGKFDLLTTEQTMYATGSMSRISSPWGVTIDGKYSYLFACPKCGTVRVEVEDE